MGRNEETWFLNRNPEIRDRERKAAQKAENERTAEAAAEQVSTSEEKGPANSVQKSWDAEHDGAGGKVREAETVLPVSEEASHRETHSAGNGKTDYRKQKKKISPSVYLGIILTIVIVFLVIAVTQSKDAANTQSKDAANTTETEVKTMDIEPEVLVDNTYMTITATGAELSSSTGYVTGIILEAENHMSTSGISLAISDAFINSLEGECGLSMQDDDFWDPYVYLDPNASTEVVAILFSPTESHRSYYAGNVEVTEADFTLQGIQGEKNYDDSDITLFEEAVTVYPFGEDKAEPYVYEPGDDDVAVFESDAFDVYFISAQRYAEDSAPEARFLVINQTEDQTFRFQAEGPGTTNGVLMSSDAYDYFDALVLPPGKMAYAYIGDRELDDLNAQGELTQMSFSLSVYAVGADGTEEDAGRYELVFYP